MVCAQNGDSLILGFTEEDLIKLARGAPITVSAVRPVGKILIVAATDEEAVVKLFVTSGMQMNVVAEKPEKPQ